MEIILLEDVKNLGYKDDIVEVKAGYGRNYLIPQKMAIIANATNRKVLAENVRQASHKADKVRQDAQNIADAIGDTVFQVSAKVGESGKIFGAVTPLQIADVLKEKGFEVDRRRISLEGDVKTLGNYVALLDLHKEVKHRVNFEVVAAE